MGAMDIAPGVQWVGILDPQLRVFDVVMKAENGTTYNSYLVRGASKTALIETNKGKFSAQYIENLKNAIDPAKIDYIVLNHLEPDHSGALSDLLQVAVNATLVFTRPGKSFAENIVNRVLDNSMVVVEGDKIDLGGKTLEFLIEPYLHWPDTMFTWVPEDRILFPCDFMGAHYCDDRLFDDLVSNYDYAFRYYFQAIMRPFKEHVLRAAARVEKLSPLLVCPSHGPVLRSSVKKRLDEYRCWAMEPKKGDKKLLLVLYASAYGNTAKMAEAVSSGAAAAGVETSLFDLTATDIGSLLDEVERADGIAIGSCTINGDALPHTWEFLASLIGVKTKGMTGGAFGSYGWSGEGPLMLTERMRGLRFKIPSEPLRARLVPTGEDLKGCEAFGAKLAESMKS
jgi:flavorubredoxin